MNTDKNINEGKTYLRVNKLIDNLLKVQVEQQDDFKEITGCKYNSMSRFDEAEFIFVVKTSLGIKYLKINSAHRNLYLYEDYPSTQLPVFMLSLYGDCGVSFWINLNEEYEVDGEQVSNYLIEIEEIVDNYLKEKQMLLEKRTEEERLNQEKYDKYHEKFKNDFFNNFN